MLALECAISIASKTTTTVLYLFIIIIIIATYLEATRSGAILMVHSALLLHHR